MRIIIAFLIIRLLLSLGKDLKLAEFDLEASSLAAGLILLHRQEYAKPKLGLVDPLKLKLSLAESTVKLKFRLHATGLILLH